jgi:hypothetical protein
LHAAIPSSSAIESLSAHISTTHPVHHRKSGAEYPQPPTPTPPFQE